MSLTTHEYIKYDNTIDYERRWIVMARPNKNERVNVRLDQELDKDLEYIKTTMKKDKYLDLSESDIVRASIRYYKKYLEDTENQS